MRPTPRLAILVAGLAGMACASAPVAPGGGGSADPPAAGRAGELAGGASPAAPGSPRSEARAALVRFASALRDGRWTDAWALLSAAWMARLTPERLAADWRESGAVGPRALARLEAALAAGLPLAVEPGGLSASLPVGEGKAATLVLEDGRWRVASLE